MEQAKNFHIVTFSCCFITTVSSGEAADCDKCGGSCFEINSLVRPGLTLLASIPIFCSNSK